MFTRLWKALVRWISRVIDSVTTIKSDGRVIGRVYLFHSGSIIHISTIYDQQQPDELDVSQTIDSFHPH
jgi:hypothetical protein